MSEDQLDSMFGALADPTRRALLAQLTEGPAPVGLLAAHHDMSQPAISKHLRVLEGAGLIRREARGRERLAHLEIDRLDHAMDWLQAFRDRWNGRLDALDHLLDELKNDEGDPS